MANERVILRRGLADTIPSARVPGTILVETDTGRVWVDDNETDRIQFKDDTKLPLDGKAEDSEHADTADALKVTAAIGSSRQGVYIDANGKPQMMSYSVNKTVPANAVFTDTNTKVTQNAAITTNGNYPILLGANTETITTTSSVNKATGFTYNPGTGTLSTPNANVGMFVAESINCTGKLIAADIDSSNLVIDDGSIDG